MSATPTEGYKKYRWFWFSLQISLGLLMFFLIYIMYIKMLEEDNVVKNSPLVCMQITGRERGAGTFKLPDIIYAGYQGKKYKFDCGRKYFRSTFALDSIQVHYDAQKNIAALPTLNFPHYTFLVIMMIGAGLIIVIDSIVTLRKYQ